RARGAARRAQSDPGGRDPEGHAAGAQQDAGGAPQLLRGPAVRPRRPPDGADREGARAAARDALDPRSGHDAARAARAVRSGTLGARLLVLGRRLGARAALAAVDRAADARSAASRAAGAAARSRAARDLARVGAARLRDGQLSGAAEADPPAASVERRVYLRGAARPSADRGQAVRRAIRGREARARLSSEEHTSE